MPPLRSVCLHRLGATVLLALATASHAASSQSAPALRSNPDELANVVPSPPDTPPPAILPANPLADLLPEAPLPPPPPPDTRALPLVNGRPYRKPTPSEQLKAYEHELVGTRAFVSAGIRSGIEQARTKPVGWGQDFPGYLQRYGSAYGEAAINNSVRFAMGAALHEDVRYLICHHCSGGDKFENAVLSEFTSRRGDDGHRGFSPTPIVASFSGPLVAYAAWYPPGYDVADAAKHSALGFGTRIVFKLVREFLFDRDTKAEKAIAAQKSSTTAATP